MQGNFNETERIARQLEAVEARFEELSIRITLPEVIADGALFARLMREHSELSELNDLAVAYRKLLGDIAGAKEMLSDPELREMAEEELRSLEAQLEEKTHEARLALLPKDPDDRKNALIEVRAGAGPLHQSGASRHRGHLKGRNNAERIFIRFHRQFAGFAAQSRKTATANWAKKRQTCTSGVFKRTLALLLDQRRLLGEDQRVDDLVEVAFHDFVNLVQR